MNVLLTSSGGYQAPGLRAMRDGLIASGFNVLTVAPVYECEHTARSVSPKVCINIDQVGDDLQHPIYKVDGTTVDCVRLAILSGIARDVSVVVSGIGDRTCLGELAHYSSIIGGAMEAISLGYPALAIFQETGEGNPSDFEWSAVVGGELAAWLGSAADKWSSGLCVNVPAARSTRQIKQAVPAQRIWDPEELGIVSVDEDTGRITYRRPFSKDPQFELKAGTDAMLLSSGHVSVTHLTPELTSNFSADYEEWLKMVVTTTNTRIGASGVQCETGCCG